MIASGSVTDFTEAVQTSIAKKFAAAASVPLENVTVTISPGSVLITAKVVVENSTALASTMETLRSDLSTTAAASLFLSTPALNVAVVSTPRVVPRHDNVVAYPPPPPPPVSKFSGGAIAAIAVGSFLGLALVAFILVNTVKGKGSAKRDDQVTLNQNCTANLDTRMQENTAVANYQI